MMINTDKSKIYAHGFMGDCDLLGNVLDHRFYKIVGNYSFTFLWVLFPSCQSKMHWEQCESYSFMKFIIVPLVVICTSYTQEMTVKSLFHYVPSSHLTCSLFHQNIPAVHKSLKLNMQRISKFFLERTRKQYKSYN